MPAPAARITAVILAAGRARRMGRLKQLLPWGATTVLGATIARVQATPVTDVLVVVGHEADAVAACAAAAGAAVVVNPDYDAGELLSSLQVAVRTLRAEAAPPAAVLVVLGDQPLLEPETMAPLLDAFHEGRGALIAPVYDGRRGNPVLIGSRHFDELLALPRGAAPRDLLRARAAELTLVPVASPSILLDLDRPADYARHRPDRGQDVA